MLENVARGVIAGAVGTMALDIATYVDMAVRGRPPSQTPEKFVEKLVERSDQPQVRALAEPSPENKNRRSAIGALLGYGVGLEMGMAYGALRSRVRNVPWPVMGMLAGAAVMAASNIPLTRLGATDPKQWSKTDWLSDIIPHAFYGLSTAAVFEAITA